MADPALTRGEVREALRHETRLGATVSLHWLHDRLCRTDAVGRISKADSALFDAVIEEMCASGEMRMQYPFISSVKHRLA